MEEKENSLNKKIGGGDPNFKKVIEEYKKNKHD